MGKFSQTIKLTTSSNKLPTEDITSLQMESAEMARLELFVPPLNFQCTGDLHTPHHAF